MGDGIAFYRSTNNVIPSDGLGGVVGPKYIRPICRITRNPILNRTLFRGNANPIRREEKDGPPSNRRKAGDSIPVESAIARTNAGHVETSIDADSAPLASMGGLNPFSETDQELPETEEEDASTGEASHAKEESGGDSSSNRETPTNDPPQPQKSACYKERRSGIGHRRW